MSYVSLKNVFLMAAVLAVAPVAARAQDAPAADLFVGGSYMSDDLPGGRDHLGGVHVAAAYNITDVFAIEGEVAAYNGDHTHVSAMAGPRLTARGERASAFAHALFGGVSAGDVAAFQMAVGGGVDVNLTKRVDLRVVQVDWVRLGFDNGGNNARVSAGLVIRF